MFYAVSSGHFDNHRLIGQQTDGELALCLVDALHAAAAVGEPVSGLVDVEDGVDVVLDEVVIRVEYVIVIAVGVYQVFRHHVIALVEILDAVAVTTRQEAPGQQNFAVIAG